MKRLLPLLFFLHCGEMDHPGADVRLEYSGFDDNHWVPTKGSITEYFKIKVLGIRGTGQSQGSSNPQPLNQVKIKIFSPEGKGQVYAKSGQAVHCPRSSYHPKTESPRGGYQFLLVLDGIDQEVCTPFEAQTDQYGEVQFGIEVSAKDLVDDQDFIPVNVIVVAGFLSEIKTVFFTREGIVIGDSGEDTSSGDRSDDVLEVDDNSTDLTTKTSETGDTIRSDASGDGS